MRQPQTNPFRSLVRIMRMNNRCQSGGVSSRVKGYELCHIYVAVGAHLLQTFDSSATYIDDLLLYKILCVHCPALSGVMSAATSHTLANIRCEHPCGAVSLCCALWRWSLLSEDPRMWAQIVFRERLPPHRAMPSIINGSWLAQEYVRRVSFRSICISNKVWRKFANSSLPQIGGHTSMYVYVMSASARARVCVWRSSSSGGASNRQIDRVLEIVERI